MILNRFYSSAGSVTAKNRPEPDVLIAGFAQVGDITAMNDGDWLMLGDAELDSNS